MEHSLVIVVVVAALVFDYINGFHDAANSIATVVSTRVLSPGKAVVWAAFLIFAAYTAISAGTLSGGWRIIHTMGSKITRLQPVGGFAAETRRRRLALPGGRRSPCRSAPRTPSPGQSSAWARYAGCRQCGGASPVRSSGRGC